MLLDVLEVAGEGVGHAELILIEIAVGLLGDILDAHAGPLVDGFLMVALLFLAH